MNDGVVLYVTNDFNFTFDIKELFEIKIIVVKFKYLDTDIDLLAIYHSMIINESFGYFLVKIKSNNESVLRLVENTE